MTSAHERVALYPGSFDPLTRGHVRLIQRALSLFDRVVVAIAVNISKQPLFSFEERSAFIHHALPEAPIEVVTIQGLLIEEARRLECSAILRGLRSSSDFDYEFRMTSMNSTLADDIETVFLMSDPQDLFISSSLIKEVARFGGDIQGLVPDEVAQALKDRYARF